LTETYLCSVYSCQEILRRNDVARLVGGGSGFRRRGKSPAPPPLPGSADDPEAGQGGGGGATAGAFFGGRPPTRAAGSAAAAAAGAVMGLCGRALGLLGAWRGWQARAVASFSAAVLTEIYLCNVCSCQEILRRNDDGSCAAAAHPRPLCTPVRAAGARTVRRLFRPAPNLSA
jgi:hypothetical protein